MLMIETKSVLNRLQQYKGSPFPILTVYLSSDSKKSPSSTMLVTLLHSLVQNNLSIKQKKEFKKDIRRVENYLQDTYDSRGNKSVVCISAGDKLFEVLPFEFYLPEKCVVANSPYLAPVEEAVRWYTQYLVLVVDRAKARIFRVHLGKIEEHSNIFNGIVPQKVMQLGDAWGRDAKIRGHIEEHLHRHLSLIAVKTAAFAQKNPSSFLIIGGHKRLIPKVKRHLPLTLQKKILGEFVTELNIPLHKILLLSKKVATEVNEKKVWESHGFSTPI